jgi:anti-sigma B factor antagonist
MLEEGRKQIVIDLEKVGFMNSSGLGILIGGVGMLKGAGGGLRLANASPKIASLITIARLGSVLETYPSVKEAVASFKK